MPSFDQEVRHARALVPLAREGARSRGKDGLARLLVAAGHQVDLVLARRLETPREPRAHGRRPQALSAQVLDGAQQR